MELGGDWGPAEPGLSLPASGLEGEEVAVAAGVVRRKAGIHSFRWLPVFG